MQTTPDAGMTQISDGENPPSPTNTALPMPTKQSGENGKVNAKLSAVNYRVICTDRRQTQTTRLWTRSAWCNVVVVHACKIMRFKCWSLTETAIIQSRTGNGYLKLQRAFSSTNSVMLQSLQAIVHRYDYINWLRKYASILNQYSIVGHGRG